MKGTSTRDRSRFQNPPNQRACPALPEQYALLIKRRKKGGEKIKKNLSSQINKGLEIPRVYKVQKENNKI